MFKNKLMLLDIFVTFFKLGCFSFGGGYAMIPLIEREVVSNKKWIEDKDIVDIFAVSQSIPGAIAMNSSAFIGYYVAGIPGAISALLGNITPPFAIVLTLSVLFTKFSSYTLVQAAFMGIRPVIVSLIALAAFKVIKTSVKDKAGIIIMAAAFICAFYIHPIFIIIGGIIAGVSITAIKTRAMLKNKQSEVAKESDINADTP